MQLPPMWQVTPLGLAAVTTGVVHEVGLRWLALRQTPAHRRASRRRSWLFYAGLAGVALVASGPLERWSMAWLSVHMVVHVLEMIYLPVLLVLGAPWVPLAFAVPVDQRRRLLGAFYRSRAWAWTRGAAAAVTNPVVAIVLFNGVVLFWHDPAVFDWASWHQWTMDWLMAPSFVVAGVLFWRVLLPSHPWPARGSVAVQIGAIVVTSAVMLVVALAMGLDAGRAWYSMNTAMLGPTHALQDQHWAAGVLWLAGDLWVVPAFALVGFRVHRLRAPEEEVLERVLDAA